MEADCLFCRIIAGDIPAQIIDETPDGIVFRDIAAQAPVHLLVVPRRHIQSLATATDEGELGRLMMLVRRAAQSEGIAESGYRVVMNTNDDGGQTVHHFHIHVLGGRKMTWPPG